MNGDRPDRLAHTNVRAILEVYMDRHNVETSYPWLTSPKNVEVAVAFPLYVGKTWCLCGHTQTRHEVDGVCDSCDCTLYQNTLAFCGRLDVLGHLRDDPRILCPVDHKTTGQLGARFVQQYQLDSQLSGYMWLAEQYSGQSVRVAFINAIELGILPTSDRKCAKHGVPYVECGPEHVNFQVVGPIERTQQQIDEWADTAIKLALQYRRLITRHAREIHDLRTEGTFNGSCSFCEFREFCLADRPVKQIDRMFTNEPWSPWDHVFEGKKAKRDPLTMYVDNSILKATAACSTQAAMRYGWGYTSHEQAWPLAAGIAVHKGLEVYFKGGTTNEALAAFDKLYLGAEAAA